MENGSKTSYKTYDAKHRIKLWTMSIGMGEGIRNGRIPKRTYKMDKKSNSKYLLNRLWSFFGF